MVAVLPTGRDVLRPVCCLALLALGGCRARETVTTRQFDPDLSLVSLTQVRPEPQRVHVLLLAPQGIGRLRITTAGPTLLAKRSLPDLAAEAAAGVNGGYFDVTSGAPLGAVKVAGEWIAMPLFDRTALLLPRSGCPRIAAVAWRGEVITADGRRPIEWLNRTPPAGASCAVTTPRWPGARQFPGLRATAVGDLLVHTAAPLRPPVTVALRSDPDCDGSILGGGPRLLRDGQIDVTKGVERFRPDVAESVTARSAVGLTAGGEVVLAMAEGGTTASRGLSLEAWAAWLRRLGCRDAMALDSHTMSTLVAHGALVGRPLTGQAQPIATALLVGRP